VARVAALFGAVALLLVAAVPPTWARPAPDSFADLAARLLPAVVNVSSSQVVQADNGRLGPELPNFPPGSPFEQFFHDFLDRNRPPGGPLPGAPPRRMQSLGSGFIIDPSGLIVTNNHVIEGADQITVTLQDNTTLKATVVGRDERTDIALLKVKADKPLPAVSFGDSAHARVGDWVLAIGNPFGLGGSVTAGIVSARGRDIQQGPYDDFIQTDAAINRGNSGGPLFNMDGEVIGINTAIYSPSGGSIGIGFAIPANLAKPIVAQLRASGKVVRGWLGVKIQAVTPEIADSMGLKQPEGALVANVEPGGPAAAAGLHGGDIILRFAGHEIREMHMLPRIVAMTPVGSEAPVVVWRNGQELTLTATVGKLPEEKQLARFDTGAPPTTELASLGLTLASITADARQHYQLDPHQSGVLIVGVAANSPAAERGLQAGDVIEEVQQHRVGTPAEVVEQVARQKAAGRHTVLLLVASRDGPRWVPLSLAAGREPR
jgi:serine protease Do